MRISPVTMTSTILMRTTSVRPMKLLATATIALTLVACGGPLPSAVGTIEADASQVTTGMRLKMTEEGVLKADLEADTAISRPNQSKTDLKNVRLTTYTPGKPPTKLTARTGEYDPQTGMMVARGKVVLITPGDKGMRTVRSEELHWDQRGDRVWSDRETQVEEGGRTVWTQGFKSDGRFTNIQGSNARTSKVPVGEGGIRF